MNRLGQPISLTILAASGLIFGACGDDDSLASNAPVVSTNAAVDGVLADANANHLRGGTITIALDMRPKVPDDVPFATQGKGLKDFALDDDSDPQLPNVRTFSNLKAGTYAVQQLATPDGPLVQIRCSSSVTDNNTVDVANGTATIVLEAGESVVCTFVDGWEPFDLVDFSQVEWGAEGSTAESILNAGFFTVYPDGFLEIGIPGTAGFSDLFEAPSFIVSYLPRSGTPAPLTADLLDPSTDASGIFGAEVLALKLNVDYSDAQRLDGSGIPFGDLVLCDFPAVPLLNGMTVRQLHAIAETLLGGGSDALSIVEVATVIQQINSAFPAFFPVAQYAQDHLFIGACPP